MRHSMIAIMVGINVCCGLVCPVATPGADEPTTVLQVESYGGLAGDFYRFRLLSDGTWQRRNLAGPGTNEGKNSKEETAALLRSLTDKKLFTIESDKLPKANDLPYVRIEACYQGKQNKCILHPETELARDVAKQIDKLVKQAPHQQKIR